MRRCYGSWTDRDSSTFPELAHPDVIIDLSRDIFIPGVHRGSSGLRSDQQLPMKVEVREERQFTSTAALLELAEDGAE